MSAMTPEDMILLTGATGYIGGELLPVLDEIAAAS